MTKILNLLDFNDAAPQPHMSLLHSFGSQPDLGRHMGEIARLVLGSPNGRLSSVHELRYGTHGSLSVKLQDGVWFCHETQRGGGVLDLLREHANLSKSAALDWLRERGFLPEQPKPKAEPRSHLNIVATYDYVDEYGELQFQVVRLEPKDFRQRQPDMLSPDGWIWNRKGTRDLPYRLPDIVAAVHDSVFIVEGEKDADALALLDFVATTNAGGAGKWTEDLTPYFAGKVAYVLADNDNAGASHARKVARSLYGTAAEVRIVNLPGLPHKGDVSDWLAVNDPASLVDLCQEAPVWRPEEAEAEPDESSDAVGREITTVCAADLHGKPVPRRLWHVNGLIPANNVTLLGGDGGTGKSLLALQLACSTARGCSWIEYKPRKGRVIFLSAEDDIDELHRRLDDVARGYRCELSDLSDLVIVPLAGEDAVLAAPKGHGSNMLETTPLWRTIEAKVAELKPTLVVLDTLADLFGGEENARVQARQFISLLRGLALKQETTVVLLAHPSQSGMASGSGSSGSTSWNNSVRSRLYFERVLMPDERGKPTFEPDPDLRLLSTKKSNYGRVGGELRVRWERGLFWREVREQASGEDGNKVLEAETIFMQMLTAYTDQGRPVSATPSANYAPTLFASDPEARGVSRNRLKLAMNRLFAADRIRVEEIGPPSRRQKRIIEVGPEKALEDEQFEGDLDIEEDEYDGCPSDALHSDFIPDI
ncbi:AAA family ATPase [Methylobacterium nigriterrae]|uniref:AAA family ATPase n=1 Tax=Methylobacterium nigriterrae TaxID=3127512 RepID=UPI003013F970